MNLSNSRPREVPIIWLGAGAGNLPSSSYSSESGLYYPHFLPYQGTAERKPVRELDRSRQHHDAEQIGFCVEYFKMYTVP